MSNKIYKIIIIGLIISLTFTIFVFYQLNKVEQFRPIFADGKILAYQNQICHLQEQLGYPVCQVDGKIIEFDSNYFDMEGCKFQFKIGQQKCTLSNGTIIKNIDEFEN